MSEIKISDLTETTSVDEDITYVPIDDGTSTKKISLKNLEESATASAQAYAEAAAASATSASGYADAASTSASNASTYASNAADSAAIAESASSAASGYADTASAAASTASLSASSAAGSATSASQQVSKAQNYAKLSESWTQGNTGTRAGEDTNNAKYWAQQAATMHDGVASFNGRQGIVNPADGDYSASMISRGSSTVDDDLTSLENDMSTAKSNIEDLQTDKVNTSDIANNLTTTTAGKVLDARQGKELNDSISNTNTAITNKHKVTRIWVNTSSWVQDTTSQSGTTLYKKSVALNNVYVASPSVDIANANNSVLPTAAQQTDYDLVEYVTVDDTVPCLYIYASDIPTTGFWINVEGVD